MGGRLGYRPALDGIRAVSIAGVIALHGWRFHIGYLGVEVFFVLSGFLITTLLLEEWDDRGAVSLRAFYRRRGLRLFPALALLVAVYFMVREATGVGNLRHGVVAAVIALTYTTDLVMPLSSHLAAFGHLSHLWTLAVEEQFYLLWPPLLLFALRRHVKARTVLIFLLLCASALALEAGLTPTRGARAYAPDKTGCAILFGCAAAIAVKRLGFHIGQPVAAALLLVAAAGCTLTAYAVLPPYANMPVFSACVAAIIVHVVGTPHGKIDTLLSRKPLVGVGRVSYGIYLWHVPLFAVYGAYLGLAATAVMVVLSWRLVEQPFMRFRHKTCVTTTTTGTEVPA